MPTPPKKHLTFTYCRCDQIRTYILNLLFSTPDKMWRAAVMFISELKRWTIIQQDVLFADSVQCAGAQIGTGTKYLLDKHFILERRHKVRWICSFHIIF